MGALVAELESTMLEGEGALEAWLQQGTARQAASSEQASQLSSELQARRLLPPLPHTHLSLACVAALAQLWGQYSSTRPNISESHSETPVLEYPFSTPPRLPRVCKASVLHFTPCARVCPYAPSLRFTLLRSIWPPPF